MTTDTEISMNAAMADVDGVFTRKTEKKPMVLKAFVCVFCGQHVTVSLQTDFGKRLVKHCGAKRLAMERCWANVLILPPCTDRRPQAGKTCLNKSDWST